MDVNNEDVQKIIGMPDAHLLYSLVKLRGDKNIDLIEYFRPKGKSLDLTTSNTGDAHLAFEMSDITALYQDLSNQGVTFISPPVWAQGNDSQGQWGVCYLKGTENITFELIGKKNKNDCRHEHRKSG